MGNTIGIAIAKGLPVLLAIGLSASVGCRRGAGRSTSPPQERETSVVTIQVRSEAFQHGRAIPKRYTADGANLSPPLAISSLPAGTKELALIMDDPDAPRGTWVHWVLYKIPSDATELPEGIAGTERLSEPPGAMQGLNSASGIGYFGPAPPPGKPHRYFFKVYALDAELDVQPGLTKQQLLKAVEGHIIGRGELMGTYQREER